MLGTIASDASTVCLKCFTDSTWPILVVGSIPDLGEWNPLQALPMQFEMQLDGIREWRTAFDCAPGQDFEFKFVAALPSGFLWEADEVRKCSPDARWNELAASFRSCTSGKHDPGS